ncbi:PH domain-containing protein [Halococcus sp. PRR34]|uniref:PH domain-containing protein n=1 Tax=Halococcus sp. PRR34 TaxID=3020830 RepID=UPI00235F16C0|nr:PH domain-containing protein [Halococcus sp. PRR34]
MSESEPEVPEWMHLSDNEELLWSGHQSMWTYIPTYLTGAILIAAAAALPIIGVSLPASIPVTILGVSVVLVIAGIGVLAVTYLQYRTHLYAITTEQVFHRSGILSRNIDQVRMEQIQNTSCNQSVVERLLSFGTVQLDTAGTANVELNLWGIHGPRKVNRIVTNRLNEMSTGSRNQPAQESTQAT